MIPVSPEIARRMAVLAQRLAGPRSEPSADGMLEVVRQLGCLQLDPISAVARSHQLVLWSRVGNYQPADFETLMWERRQLFEYWAHCASIVLTEEYPIHQALMGAYAQGSSAWAKRVQTFMEANAGLREHILEELRSRGPLRSRHFEAETISGWHSSGWTSGRNVSQMLDFLWLSGTIMVAGRPGGQKAWGLTERFLPEWTPREQWSPDEIVRHSAQKSLRALGVATASQIKNHFIRGRYPGLKQALDLLETEGRIVRLTIRDEQGAWPGVWYVHADDLATLEHVQAGAWEPRTRLLSPFDNLVCDRGRTEMLFDFRFRIEIYVPKAKREYGYYVLPILHGDQLIGRIDPLMDRKAKRLRINAVYAEPHAGADPEAAPAIAQTIEELATFLGAREIEYAEPVPPAWQATLR